MRPLAVSSLAALLALGCHNDSSSDHAPGDRDDGIRSRDGSVDDDAPGGSSKSPAPLPPAEIRWRACSRGFECGTMSVPRDYADPAAGSIELALLRQRARGKRIGVLLLNPGGPGGSAIDYLASFAEVDTVLGERFDLVAFDPRGVGQSTPLDCHETVQSLVAADPTPDDDAEWSAVDAESKRFADACAAKHGDLLPHLGTPNVARDMDRVREALGDDRLNYLGFSYGTAIGAWYAALFPQRVRAMVLDGAVDLTLSGVELALEQGRGFEDALENFFAWCAGGPLRCPWTRGQAPAAAFKRLSDQADRAPIPARGADRPAGPGEFTLGVMTTLYSGELGWYGLSDALDRAAAGDGTALVRLCDGYLGRDLDGRYGAGIETNNAVNCLDKPTPDTAGLMAERARFEAEAPQFGTAALTGLFVCAHWPAKQSETKLPPPAGAPPILVIGTTGDPATPYAWSAALAEQVGSGVLLTFEGEGHTAYGRGVPCVQSAVHAYLIDEVVPRAGTRCGSGVLQQQVAAAPLRLLRAPLYR